MKHRSHAARAAVPSTWLVATTAVFAMFALLAVLLARPATSDAASQAANATVVSTASTNLGRILVNSRGHTLYMFSKDRNDKSACNGMCATFWKPLIAVGKTHGAAGVRPSLLGTTRRSDGRRQVTYNRHPLYTFVQDTKKGQTKGEGLTAFGGNWFAISPAGAKVAKRQPATGGGGGGGYNP